MKQPDPRTWSPSLVVFIYLGAVVAANLSIAYFGPQAVAPVAFFLVGFVMVARDKLHDRWSGSGSLPLRMGTVVLLGGFFSYVANADAGRVALASAVAFAFSETANALAYEPLYRRRVRWLWRVNLGNIPNAVVDSLLFVLIAFGWNPTVILLQALAKLAGGWFWSMTLNSYRTSGT